MIDPLSIAQHGIGLQDAALTINRVAVGAFFGLSGYHKLFNHDRHTSLRDTLIADHVPFIRLNEWLVPSVEFLGGFMVAAGAFAPLFALPLLIVCLVATCVDGYKRVAEYAPIDIGDRVDDYLYLPEVLYIIGLIVIVGAGPGITI